VNDQHRSTINTIVLYLPVHLSVVALTWRDINRRPPNEIRGSKRPWRIASALNTLGAAAYWLAARRET
jgi:hypothetical protein